MSTGSAKLGPILAVTLVVVWEIAKFPMFMVLGIFHIGLDSFAGPIEFRSLGNAIAGFLAMIGYIQLGVGVGRTPRPFPAALAIATELHRISHFPDHQKGSCSTPITSWQPRQLIKLVRSMT